MRLLGGMGCALALLAVAGCTPQQALLASILPDGTVSALLSHLEREDDTNRKRIAEMEARRDWNGIAKLADENVARDRNSADWWFVAGYAHSQAGRHQRAVDCFSEVVRLVPDDTAGWSLLAQSYRDAKQPARAVQAINTAHQIRAGTPSSYFLLGESYADLNRDLPAAAAYRQAVQLDAEFAKAWFGLGRASARLGRAADFESALKALTQLDPKLAKELQEMRPPSR